MVPTPLDQLGRRRFSFFPAIVGAQHNEWLLRRLTSSDIEVVNTKTSQEVVIPRRFVGEVSAIEEPFIIVGLVKELEYKAGAVVPHRRRVIEMPRAVNGGAAMIARPVEQIGPAAVVGIRLEQASQSRFWKRVAACVVLAVIVVVACLQAMGSHFRNVREGRVHLKRP